MINTAKSADRRSLRYSTIDELLRDIDALVQADQVGSLRPVGNWTLGQAFGHLAAWIAFGFDGYPFDRPPWLIRVILRRKGKKYLRDGMAAGVRIPKVKNGTYATEVIATEEGAKQLTQALQRLQDGEPAKYDSPAFGPMSHDDRVRLNLRHAELHLSFFRI